MMKNLYLSAMWLIGMMALALVSCNQEVIDEASDKMYTVTFVQTNSAIDGTKVSWDGSVQKYPYGTNVTASASTWCQDDTYKVTFSGGDGGNSGILTRGDSYTIASKIAKDYIINYEVTRTTPSEPDPIEYSYRVSYLDMNGNEIADPEFGIIFEGESYSLSIDKSGISNSGMSYHYNAYVAYMGDELVANSNSNPSGFSTTVTGDIVVEVRYLKIN